MVVAKDQSQYPTVLKLASLKEKMNANTVSFAGSLISNFNRYGKLTPKQFDCVEKLIIRLTTPAPEQVSVPNIKKMIDNASLKIKRVKITLKDASGTAVVFKNAGPNSIYFGKILISNGASFGSFNNKFFGTIDTDGKFIPTANVNSNILSLIQEFDSDPITTAAKYGKMTGSCCFCRKTLSDKRSTDVGYGPICADKFNLPWN